MSKIVLIGLTGGIASGKTEAALFFKKKGVAVISADAVGKEVMDNPDSGMTAWVRNTFGNGFFHDSGELNRRKFGDEVFSDPQKKKLLDERIFPLIYSSIKKQIESLREDHSVIIVDAAMIFEWGIEADFDIILTIAANEKNIITRVSDRDGFNIKQVKMRIASQIDPSEKMKKSHFIIENNRSLEEFYLKLEKFWEENIVPRIS